MSNPKTPRERAQEFADANNDATVARLRARLSPERGLTPEAAMRMLAEAATKPPVVVLIDVSNGRFHLYRPTKRMLVHARDKSLVDVPAALSGYFGGFIEGFRKAQAK